MERLIDKGMRPRVWTAIVRSAQDTYETEILISMETCSPPASSTAASWIRTWVIEYVGQHLTAAAPVVGQTPPSARCTPAPVRHGARVRALQSFGDSAVVTLPGRRGYVASHQTHGHWSLRPTIATKSRVRDALATKLVGVPIRCGQTPKSYGFDSCGSGSHNPAVCSRYVPRTIRDSGQAGGTYRSNDRQSMRPSISDTPMSSRG